MGIMSGIGGTTENEFYIGNRQDGYKTIYAYNSDTNVPGIRWNDDADQWEISNDGSTWGAIGGGADYPITETQGGTNQTSYVAGDILYASATNTLSTLAKGTDSQVLSLSGGIPFWDSFVGLTLVADGNTGGGTNVIDSLTTGDYNTAFGYNAGTALTSGHNNVLMGYQAGDALTTGYRNVLIGVDAGGSMTTSSYDCIGIGYHAFGNIARAYESIAIGSSALLVAASVTGNISIGFESGYNTTGSRNTYLGHRAGYSVTSSNYNVAVGEGALAGNVKTGSYNTGVGNDAGAGISTGEKNTFIGALAGGGNATTASNCVCIGYSSKVNYSSNNIVIGNDGASSASYGIVIGDTNNLYSGADYSIAIGASHLVNTNVERALLIGYNHTGSHDDTLLIGSNLTTFATDTAVIGYPSTYFGKGIAEDITLYAYNSDTNKPYLRYNDATSAWQYSNNGIDGYDIGSGSGGGGDSYPSILYNSTTPVATAQASPSPFDGNSLVVDGYLLLDADVPLAALGMAPSSTHTGTTLQIIGQTDYTSTYAGGNINIQSGDGVSAGNIILKMGDSNQGNLIINGSNDTNMQSAEGAVFIGNADAVPAGNPTDGGYLYVENGSLKFKGSSGTITIIAPA